MMRQLQTTEHSIQQIAVEYKRKNKTEIVRVKMEQSKRLNLWN